MSKYIRRYYFVCYVLCFNFFVVSRALAEGGLPADIRTHLEANASLLDPIQLVWKQVRTSAIDQSALMKLIRYPDYAKIDFFAEVGIEYKWQGGMAYELFRSLKADRIPKSVDDNIKIIPFESEAAFDRHKVYTGTAEAGRKAAGRYPILHIDQIADPKLSPPDQRIFKAEYLLHSGYYPPQLFKELGQGMQHVVVRIVDDGGRLVSVDNVLVDARKCVQIKLETPEYTYTFVLDSQMDYALRRRIDVAKSTGETTRIVECDDYRKVREPSLWLPYKCRVTYFTWETILPEVKRQSLVTEIFEVESIDTAAISAEKFVLKYSTPGSFVSDASLKESGNDPKGVVNYRVPARPEDLAQSIAAASHELSRPISMRVLLVIGNLLLVLLLIIAIWWRRSRYA